MERRFALLEVVEEILGGAVDQQLRVGADGSGESIAESVWRGERALCDRAVRACADVARANDASDATLTADDAAPPAYPPLEQSVIPLNLEQLAKAAAALDETATAAVKNDVLRQLMQYPSLQLSQSVHWADVLPTLQHLLFDKDTSDLAFEFVFKMSNAQGVAAQQLFGQLTSILTARCGNIDSRRAAMQFVKLFRLWLHALDALVDNSQRLPSQSVKATVESAVSLLDCSSERVSLSNPLYVLALHDRPARCLRLWLHRAATRQLFLRAWRNRSTLLSSVTALAFAEQSGEMRAEARVLQEYSVNALSVMLRYESMTGLLSAAKIGGAFQSTHMLTAATHSPTTAALTLSLARVDHFAQRLLRDDVVEWATSADSASASFACRLLAAICSTNEEAFVNRLISSDNLTVELLRWCDELGNSLPDDELESVVTLWRLLSQDVRTRPFVDGKSLLNNLNRLIQKDRLDEQLILEFIAVFGFASDSVKRFKRAFYSSDYLAYACFRCAGGPTFIDCFNCAIQALTDRTSTSGKHLRVGLSNNGEFERQNLPANVVSLCLTALSTGSQCTDMVKSLLDQLQYAHDNSKDIQPITTLIQCLSFCADFNMKAKNPLTKILREILASVAIVSEKSSVLLALDSWQSIIAGPAERKQLNLDALHSVASEMDADKAVFDPELSKFLIKHCSRSPESPIRDIDDVLAILESRQRVSPAKLLTAYLNECKLEPGVGGFGGRAQPGQDWSVVLRYARNLALDVHSADVDALLDAGGGGCDYFAACLLLLHAGDAAAAHRSLQLVGQLAHATVAWPCSGGDDAFVGAVVASVWPLVDRSLRLHGRPLRRALEGAGVALLPLLIACLRQCFVNLLDWPEVCHFLLVSVVGGCRMQALFFVCFLRHLQPFAFAQSHADSLWLGILGQRRYPPFKIRYHIGEMRRMYNALEKM